MRDGSGVKGKGKKMSKVNFGKEANTANLNGPKLEKKRGETLESENKGT